MFTRVLFLILFAAATVSAQTHRAVMVNPSGVVVKPTNFWTANGIVKTDGSYANPEWVSSLAWSKVTGTPTTLAGYGITDAQPKDSDLEAIATLSTTAFGRNLLTLANAAALAGQMPDASTSQKGIVALASNAEVQTGTNAAKPVVPSALTAWWTWIKSQTQTISGAWTFTQRLLAPAGVETTGTDVNGTPVTLTVGDLAAGRYFYALGANSSHDLAIFGGGNWAGVPFSSDRTGWIVVLGNPTTSTRYVQMYVDITGGTTKEFRIGSYNFSNADVVIMPGGTEAMRYTTTGILASKSVAFEGATVDANKTTLAAIDPTQANSVSIPNRSGTLALAEDYYAELGSNQSLTSTTTMTDATGVSITVPAGRYQFTVLAACVMASTTPGAKVQWDASNVMPIRLTESFGEHLGTPFVGFSIGASNQAMRQSSGGTTNFYYKSEGVINPSSTTTIKVQFAQFASSANSITLQAGSFILARRLQ